MKKIRWINQFLMLLAIVIVSCNQSKTKSEHDKPNILIILADDAGYADFGFMGSKDMVTPNLDLLAKNGMVFTDAHVSASVCSPSRAGLLTGRYQQRFGHECNLPTDEPLAFDSAQVTIAEALKEGGYRTSIIGKWHLGDKTYQHPLKNGFDYFYGFIAGSRSYYPKSFFGTKNIRSISENLENVTFDGYLTDVFGDKAIAEVNRSKKLVKPFFMYLSFNAPHGPMEDDPKLKSKFAGHPRPIYASMVYSLDVAVGKLIQQLKDNGQYENTLIFFLSDNGGAYNNNSTVTPLKGWKGNQYEGGTRIPFFVSWPAQFNGGKTFEGLTSSLDIYKTAINAAHVAEKPAHKLDGVDLMPYINEEKVGNPHHLLFWRKDEMATVRKNNLKLITLNAVGIEDSVLYNLQNNLQETVDLSDSLTGEYDDLVKELEEWESQLKSPIWKESDRWNKINRSIYSDLMKNKLSPHRPLNQR